MKKNEVTIRSSAAEYLTFIATTGDDKESIEVRYEDENIWLTQKMLSALYKVEINTINYHIKKIYSDNELMEDSTIRNFRIVQKEGNRDVSRDVVHYNLQMIIALGFKVDNERAVQFRKWVNEIVKEYTIKGFAMDDERLKNSGSILTEKYFDELLEREIEIINPKVIVLFGNQVSSIVLNEKISVSQCRKKEFEKIINGKKYKCYSVFYPVGNGRFNIGKSIEDINYIIDNINDKISI